MKRSSIIAGAGVLSLLSFVIVQGCAADEGGDGTQNMNPLMGQGGAPGVAGNLGVAQGAAPAGVAGTPAAGATGTIEGQGGVPVTGMGGAATSPSNMAGAPAAGGTAPMGMGGMMMGMGGMMMPPVGGPPACMTAESPSNGESCTETCTDLCGMKNLGSRVCTCAAGLECDPGNTPPCMECAGCGFTVDHPLLVPPTAPFPNCAQIDDTLEGTACTDLDRCQSINSIEEDGPERFCGCLGSTWDCDSKPDTFLF